MMKLVLDTNTVLALWIFADPRLEQLLATIQTGGCTLFTREDALDELRCVLAYQQFDLTPARQADMVQTYTNRCTFTNCNSDTAPLPRCRDRDDQKFLEIARDAEADYLISRDKALLKLNRHRLVKPLFSIMTPDAFASSR